MKRTSAPVILSETDENTRRHDGNPLELVAVGGEFAKADVTGRPPGASFGAGPRNPSARRFSAPDGVSDADHNPFRRSSLLTNRTQEALEKIAQTLAEKHDEHSAAMLRREVALRKEVEIEIRRLRRENANLGADLRRAQVMRRELDEKAQACEGAAVDASMEVISLRADQEKLEQRILQYQKQIESLESSEQDLAHQVHELQRTRTYSEEEHRSEMRLVRFHTALLSAAGAALILLLAAQH